MTHLPLVTVAIRTRNRAHYLRLAAESVLSQGYGNIDLVISDDASSDETPDVCRELEQADPRVRVFRHDPPRGIYGNWQFCFEAGRGEYFALLDDDNRYLPGFLEKLVSALESTPGAAFAFADEWMIDGEGTRLPERTEADSRRYGRAGRPGGLQADTPLAAVQGAPGINSAVFLRAAFAAVGGFRASAGELADFDSFLNLASQDARSCYVPERLVEYRVHETQNTDKLLTSVPIAQSSVTILGSYRFAGPAERIRRRKLAIAYRSLGRAHLLSGDISATARALRSARQADPTHLVPLLLLSFLSLPAPLVRAALRRRYGWGWDEGGSRQPRPVTGKPGLP